MPIDWTWWPSSPLWTDSGAWDYQAPWIRPARPGTMRWALQQTVPPASEPISLAAAKAHLRVLYTDEDALITSIIQVARDYVERMTNSSLVAQTWQLCLDRWPRLDRYESWPWMAPPGTILLPRHPVQSVSTIQWFGIDGSTNTVDPTTYLVDTVSSVARIVPAQNQSWPATSGLLPQDAIVVTFVSGFVTVPPTLLQAMLLLIGHWYSNREDTVVGTRLVAISIPKSVDALLGIHSPALVG